MTAQGTIYEDCKRQLCREVGNRGDLWKYSAPREDIDAYPEKPWQKLRPIHDLEGVSPETEY